MKRIWIIEVRYKGKKWSPVWSGYVSARKKEALADLDEIYPPMPGPNAEYRVASYVREEEYE